MTNTAKSKSIEVWLRKGSIGIVCTVVNDDETTDELEVDSFTMLGAQRELTGYFLKEGYAPVTGRWDREDQDGDEVSRIFRLKARPGTGDEKK